MSKPVKRKCPQCGQVKPFRALGRFACDRSNARGAIRLPIVDAKGRAVALVSIGTERPALSTGSSSGMDGPQPILRLQLPSWVLKTVRATETKKAPKWTESSITS